MNFAKSQQLIMAIEKFKYTICPLERLTEDTVLVIMVKTRAVIENLPSYREYEHLKFYCDWCCHPTISGPYSSLQILSKITDVLYLDNLSSNNWYDLQIAQILDLPKLQTQLVCLYKELSIPTILFEKHWKEYLIYLMCIVKEYPLTFPNERIHRDVKKCYETIQISADKNNGNGAKQFKLIIVEKEKILDIKRIEIHFEITTFHPGILIRGLFPLLWSGIN